SEKRLRNFSLSLLNTKTEHITDYLNEEAKIKGKTRRTNTHKAECLLLFYVSIAKIGNDLIDITTVVQYHNALGKAYFFFIKPFHKMIVPRIAKELI
ncbi:DUF2867 domain-containing protein, partial [Bacteroides sp.]|uniref:DUF2867 domain-containing protein n=1 Tax=Bacteroides sp. TaxID=29523 RepID=UPI003A9420F4